MQLPQVYKDVLVPELVRMIESHEAAVDAGKADDSTKTRSLDVWEKASAEENDRAADTFASVDGGLAARRNYNLRESRFRQQCRR